MDPNVDVGSISEANNLLVLKLLVCVCVYSSAFLALLSKKCAAPVVLISHIM